MQRMLSQIGTSKFGTNSLKMITKYMEEVIENSSVSANGKDLIYQFSRNIGENVDGVATNTIKLFFDSKGRVRTAFPL
ncbi:hypothetical protein [Paraburkholderia xenovorans]